MKFMVCISREDCGDLSTDDFTLDRLCELITPVVSHCMTKVIDEFGEDYP